MHHHSYDTLDTKLRQSMQDSHYRSPQAERLALWSARAILGLSWLVLLACMACIGLVDAQADESFTTNTGIQSLKSRNLLFDRLTIDDGLSQGTINTITQDHKGFIWFGTQEGLNRYNGQAIDVYEHDYTNPNSLSNDWVWSLLVDQDGTLWAGTDGGGLNRFDHDTNTFTAFKHNPTDANSLSNDRVRVVYQDRQGLYWIGTDGGGLNRFDADSGQFSRYRHNSDDPNSLSNDIVLSILEDRHGHLWIGTNGGGLDRLNRSTGQFAHYRHDPNIATSLSENQVRSIYEDREGRLWIGTYEGGLNLFDADTNGFTRFQHDPDNPHSLSHNRVRHLYQDVNGTLWVATDGGLNEWSQGNGFIRYAHDLKDPASLSDDRVISIFQDRGHVLWVGTFNGVNKWNYVSDAFTYYQEYGTQLKLSNNVVTSVTESAQGEIWVGTYGGGLNQLNMSSGSVDYYRHDPADPHSLSDDRVMSVWVDAEHTVWVGTRNGGLNRLDPVSGNFTHYRHDPEHADSLSANGVTSLFGDTNGVLWVGTYGGGLNRLDPITGNFMSFRHDPNDRLSISSDRVLAVYRDRSGSLWVGTEDGGLNRFDEATQSFVHYQHDPNNRFSLGSNAAWDILEGGDGSLWIGTGGGGLNRWLPADRARGLPVFTKYRKNEGLRSDTVHGILEDNAGFLWLSSNRELTRFDPDSGDVLHFDRRNGLKGNEFNSVARVKSQSGRLYFGGPTGLLAFYPNQIRMNAHQPDIALTAFSRLGPLDTAYSSVPTDNTLELDYTHDLVTFEFTGLDYASPEKNQYRYKLEGFDTDWTDPVGFNRTTYTNLPAGAYTFRIRASNNDGVWNEKGTSIKLQVIPPPWMTGWAYACYVLMAVGLVWAYVRVQKMKLLREMEQRIELERQVQVRTHELAEGNAQLKSLNGQLKQASWTDSLTGLKNRRYLDEFIQSEVALAQRQAQAIEASSDTLPADIAPALSFMMIDLDGFKAINDNFGHHAGDEALLQVRDILQGCCRQSDTIIRWGGDEFLVVSRNTGARSAERLAERIRQGLAEHQYQLGGGHVARLSGSIGFALYPFSTQKPTLLSWEQVVAMADRVAYVAKQNGRNAWVGIMGQRNITALECEQIKDHLDSLLQNGRVRLRTSIEHTLVLNDVSQAHSG